MSQGAKPASTIINVTGTFVRSFLIYFSIGRVCVLTTAIGIND